jgi:PAS domain S-box-containing protein
VHTVVGPDGRILYDSPSVLRVLGYAQGELLGRNAFELIHPDDLPAALELLMDTAAAPGRISSLIFRFRHRTGGWRYLESVGSAVADPHGAAVIVNSRDVTDQVRARRELQVGREKLEERVRTRSAEVEELQLEMLRRLARAAELRDDETGSHTRRVASLAAALARAMALDEDGIATIERAAPLHDIGKIGVPDSILRKPGPLTPAEMEVMRTHTVIGARILAGGRSPLLRTAELVALHHHERWDGAGYPLRLARTDIPLPARIVAVADFFDALTHDRAYRPALPAEEVASEIARGAGSHFDPAVVEAFRQSRP